MLFVYIVNEAFDPDNVEGEKVAVVTDNRSCSECACLDVLAEKDRNPLCTFTCSETRTLTHSV